MADIKWIKIDTNIFADDKILLIEDMPEADAIIVIWFKLLCLAGVKNNSGVFMLNDKIPYTEKMLASIFRRKETVVNLALRTFEELGMIEIINNTITIPNWEKHQSLDKIEAARESTRERVARHREKQKLLAQGASEECNEECNVTVTLRNATDKNRVDKNRIDKIREDKNYFPNDEALNEAFLQYIEHRKAIKHPLKTEYAINLAIKNLEKLSKGDNDTAIEILNQSIMNGWQGLFELKNQNAKRQTNNNNDALNYFVSKAMEEG